MMINFKRNGLAVVGFAVMLGGCAETQFLIGSTKRLQDRLGGAGTTYKVGNPYEINGTWYYPKEEWDYDETGIASWYGPNFHGKKTANGEPYDMNELTAAHRTLPMPSFVRVTNLENGRSIVLRINDRGPFAKGRIIDVSRRGAQLLAFETNGTARVRVQVLADQSQAQKAALVGERQIAEEGSPINVAKLPKAEVSSTELPPPPGAARSPATPAAQPAHPAGAGPTQHAALPSSGPSQPEPVSRLSPLSEEEVKNVPVTPTQIYVQAGAFTNYQNAVKTQLNIGRYIKADVSHVLVGNRDFYRVRIGPLTDVQAADEALATVQRIGFTGARIIVAETGK
ncbi:MAG: septal ring lytic transglycosylase RlpA family protein [Rhodospirillaceae bacterium]